MAVIYKGTTEETRRIVHHHALLRRGLEQRVGALCAAAGDGGSFEQALAALREYLVTEILPHAEAEERTLYRAAATQARGGDLVATLTSEHRVLADLAGQLQPGIGASTAATTAEWIATLFAGHAAEENDLLLPALLEAGVDLAPLLASMHQAA